MRSLAEDDSSTGSPRAAATTSSIDSASPTVTGIAAAVPMTRLGRPEPS